MGKEAACFKVLEIQNFAFLQHQKNCPCIDLTIFLHRKILSEKPFRIIKRLKTYFSIKSKSSAKMRLTKKSSWEVQFWITSKTHSKFSSFKFEVKTFLISFSHFRQSHHPLNESTSLKGFPLCHLTGFNINWKYDICSNETSSQLDNLVDSSALGGRFEFCRSVGRSTQALSQNKLTNSQN